MQTEEIPIRAPLDKNTEAEVCIVGAGISGLTTGYMLAREGKSVVILNDGPIGGGETERTTAHLSYALDELGGKDLGLPLPRLTFHAIWRGD
jgi:glycine/D-amino acid oxidase-like deaminating enzyme